MRIITAEHRWPELAGHPSPLTAYLARYWPSRRHGPYPIDLGQRDTVDDVEAPAHVSHGRWVIACPFTPCRGAAYLVDADRRFFCVECANEQVGGQFVPVVLPDDRPAIEEALAARRVPAAANWVPGETAADLLIQLAEHAGVDVGRGG